MSEASEASEVTGGRVMRVLVCGGRDFSDYERLASVLDALHRDTPGGISLVIHGAARGADTLASVWAWQRGVEQMPCAADWTAHGRAAGPRRNARMLAEGKPDMVVAFPGGRGTADMVRQARFAFVPVMEIV